MGDIFDRPEAPKPEPITPARPEPIASDVIKDQKRRFRKRVNRDSLKVGLTLPDADGRVGIQIPGANRE